MQPGDHLITPRLGFTHHGLYIGNHEVIHYAGYSSGDESGQVVLTSLENFSDGYSCNVVNHSLRRYSREQSIDRACSRLGEAHYSALLNNCEHFVTWCIQGFHYSQQITHLVGLGMAANRVMTSRAAMQTGQALVSGSMRSSSVAPELAGNALSVGAGVVAGTATVATTSALLAGASTLIAPVAVGIGVAYGVKTLWDLLTD